MIGRLQRPPVGKKIKQSLKMARRLARRWPGAFVSIDCSLNRSSGMHVAEQRTLITLFAPAIIMAAITLCWVVYAAASCAAARWRPHGACECVDGEEHGSGKGGAEPGAPAHRLQPLPRVPLRLRLLVTAITLTFFFYMSIVGCSAVTEGWPGHPGRGTWGGRRSARRVWAGQGRSHTSVGPTNVRPPHPAPMVQVDTLMGLFVCLSGDMPARTQLADRYGLRVGKWWASDTDQARVEWVGALWV